MFTGILNVLLGYFTFLHPLIYSAQLTKEKSPDPRQVTNITLALILGWLISFSDALFLSPFFTMRSLYLLVRIILCMYLSNPTLLGALKIYEKFLAPLFDTYSPCVNDLVVQHIDTMTESGVNKYVVSMGTSLFREIAKACDVTYQLLGVMADSAVPKVSRLEGNSHQQEDGFGKRNTIPRGATKL
ncbi:unnamed protein product [Phytomonas sp. EM1]|nr:unnamed protein product [Phytomonas sp. EM1]|eukprot:CCW63238.1 unnamed protein product [Phytomonas sp. isolate EM1]